MALFGLNVYFSDQHSFISDAKSTTLSLEDLEDSDSIEIQFEGEYGIVETLSIYPYDNIVEPYRTTTLSLNTELSDDYSITWSIQGIDGISGTSVTHIFTSPNTIYKVKADITDATGEVVLTVEGEAACKYVRREIRTLTDDDRESFLDALKEVYSVTQDEGEEKYGGAFRSIASLIEEHLDGAGRMECDHWHDDAGIATHHVGYTLEMEQTLQLINPSVAIPYWDHTIDYEIYGDNKYSESPICGEDWFGEADPSSDDHEITTGRWANLSVATPSDGFDIYNSYGQLRSPWNNNPTSYVGRSGSIHGDSTAFSIPGCSVFSECFNHDSLAMINNCINGATHGPVHIKIGGAWGLVSDFISTYLPNARADLVLLFKLLWRHGYARCPDLCDEGTAFENCTCYIPDEYFDTYGSYYMMNDTNVFHYMTARNGIYYSDDDQRYHYEGVEADAEDDFFDELIANLANPGITGEMYTSAAPWDPTFWPLHPTADRLIMYRRYLHLTEQSYLNTTWGYYHDPDIPSDDQSFCDWNGVEDLELPNCYTVEYCPGHAADDLLPFKNFLGNGETYTNAEFLEFISPSNPTLPYLYDDFDYSFCDAIGEPIWPLD